MNLSKVPPLQQKRIVEFVNNFVISTVSFLDKFSNNCEISLQRLDVKLRRVEAELSILEAKLNSVNTLRATGTVSISNAPMQSTTLPGPANSSDVNPASRAVDAPQPVSEHPVESKSVEPPPAESNPPDQNDEEKPKEIPEELKRFHKMVQFGVPVQAVKLKMKAEGFNPDLLDS